MRATSNSGKYLSAAHQRHLVAHTFSHGLLDCPQRLSQARLDHEKAATKAAKESINHADPELQASVFAVQKEAEQIERFDLCSAKYSHMIR